MKWALLCLGLLLAGRAWGASGVVPVVGGSGGGSATNAVATIKTNGVNVAVNVTSLNVTGATAVAVGSEVSLTFAGGGGGTPAGSSGAVQFNQGGAFAGTNNFVYDRTNGHLTVPGVYYSSFGALSTPNTAQIFEVDNDGTPIQFILSSFFKSIYSTDPTVSLGGNDLPFSFVASHFAYSATNVVTNRLEVSSATASRPAYFDASKGLISASGSFTGTEFMRGDGVLATPSGSGGGGAGSLAFDLNQFDTNVTVTIKNGAVISGTNLSGASITPRLVLTNSVDAASNTVHSTAIFLSGKNTATAGTTNQIQSEGAWAWVPTANTIGSGTHVWMSRTNAGGGAWTTNGTLSTAGAFNVMSINLGGGAASITSAGAGSLVTASVSGNTMIGATTATPATSRFQVSNTTAQAASKIIQGPALTNVIQQWFAGLQEMMRLETNGSLVLAGGLQTQSGIVASNAASAFLNFTSTNSAMYVTNLANDLILYMTNMVHRKDCWIEVTTDGTPRTVTIATNLTPGYRVLWGYNAGNSATNSVVVTNSARINVATGRPWIVHAAVEHQVYTLP